MIKECPRCHHDNPDTARTCVECGIQLGMTDKTPVIPTETLETPKGELTISSTFSGRYQIIEELGKGGMGRRSFWMEADPDIAEVEDAKRRLAGFLCLCEGIK